MITSRYKCLSISIILWTFSIDYIEANSSKYATICDAHMRNCKPHFLDPNKLVCWDGLIMVHYIQFGRYWCYWINRVVWNLYLEVGIRNQTQPPGSLGMNEMLKRGKSGKCTKFTQIFRRHEPPTLWQYSTNISTFPLQLYAAVVVVTVTLFLGAYSE